MKIRRTANAGVLLTLDGVSILLDGICAQVPPYLETPQEIKNEICEGLPDIAAFTHFHTDHFDGDFVRLFELETGKRVLSPENRESQRMSQVELVAVPTRHIGKTDVEHISFVIKGSKTIWFMGDAGPLMLKKMAGYEKPDVLFAPFAYFNSSSSLELTKSVGAKKIIVLHLPDKNNDEFKICESVQESIKNEQNIHIINLGETIKLF